ncbi:MAG: universal stress protein [bacterium]|nr:universal stress protein [bacterium]
MKKILLAVDDTKSSLKTIDVMPRLFACSLPEKVVLLYVQKMEGRSVMDELILSDSEMETLKEAMEGTDYQDKLHAQAKKVMVYYRDMLSEKGIKPVKPLVKKGHPAEEILKTAEEEDVDLIVMGARAKRLHNLFMGSVSREVSNKAPMSVLLVK